MVLRLHAGALGVPFLPTATLIGGDLPTAIEVRPVACPYTGEVLRAVPALNPDVAILHVQRADADGHAHCWGNLGLVREAGLAARSVILTAEEIVPREVILSDPNRILLPPHRVSAVVHAPGGAYPSPVQGVYGRDHRAFGEYHQTTRERGGFLRWLDEWVLELPDHAAYLARLGGRFEALKPTHRRLAAEVDYA